MSRRPRLWPENVFRALRAMDAREKRFTCQCGGCPAHLASQHLRLTVPAGQMPAAAGAKMKRRRATRRPHHYSKAGSGMCTLPVGLSVVCPGVMAENTIFHRMATMRHPQRLLPGWSVRAWPTVPAIRKLVASLEVQTRALPRRPLTATSCTGQIATQRAKDVCPPQTQTLAGLRSSTRQLT